MSPLLFQVATDRRRFLALASAAAAATLAGACGSASHPQDTGEPGASGSSPASAFTSRRVPPRSPAPPASTVAAPGARTLRSTVQRRSAGRPADAQKSMAGFGAEMLRRVHGATGPNTAISPYSLVTVLAMARAGARGRTAAQLDAALELAGTDAQGAAITAIDRAVTAAVRDTPSGTKTVVRTANQTWVQDGYPVRQAYLDELARQFGTSVAATDFTADPESARSHINAWVAARTNKLIPQLFEPGTIHRAVRLVLVNALYLKAQWDRPFLPDVPADFSTSSGETTRVPFMRSYGQVAGARGRGWVSATPGYVAHGLSMTVMLPDDLATTLAHLDADLLATASAPTTTWELRMPPFQIHSTPDVQTAVKDLGVTDLFSPVADLSGIAGMPGDLFAETFAHQAVVLVDREGTEAAASTGLVIAESSAPAGGRELVLDRPFLFWIHDDTTGAPLFLGVVGDPTAS